MMICRTLKFYEELLAESGFLRVHKSHLINLEHVSKYARGKGGVITMTNGMEISVSPQKKDLFLEQFERGRWNCFRINRLCRGGLKTQRFAKEFHTKATKFPCHALIIDESTLSILQFDGFHKYDRHQIDEFPFCFLLKETKNFAPLRFACFVKPKALNTRISAPRLIHRSKSRLCIKDVKIFVVKKIRVRFNSLFHETTEVSLPWDSSCQSD